MAELIPFHRRMPNPFTAEDYLILADSILMFYPNERLAQLISDLNEVVHQHTDATIFDMKEAFRMVHTEIFLTALIQELHDRDYWFSGGYGDGPLILHTPEEPRPADYAGPAGLHTNLTSPTAA